MRGVGERSGCKKGARQAVSSTTVVAAHYRKGPGMTTGWTKAPRSTSADGFSGFHIEEQRAGETSLWTRMSKVKQAAFRTEAGRLLLLLLLHRDHRDRVDHQKFMCSSGLKLVGRRIQRG